MQNRIVILALACTASATLAPRARAQAPAATPVDTAHHAADSVAPPKKGGMFGKMKALAHNKTAQNIVKAAACTAIPGGQYMVGAIDAKSQAKAAVAGAAAGVATGVATKTMGTSCIPGMGSPTGLAGMGGIGGAGKASAISGLSAMAMSRAMPKGAGAATPAGNAANAANAANAPTMSAQMQMMTAQNQANGNTPVETEAPGQQMQMPTDLAADLKKGKLVIRKVDWIQKSGALSAPTTQMFSDVMGNVGGAIKQSGQRYRVDVYVDKNYSDEEVTSVGGQRVAMILALLDERAGAASSMQGGQTKKDKEPRIEFVKIK